MPNDFGPGGKWIHDRAHHIMSKNPSMSKSIAYAVATQQAHKVGKSPKGFRTAEGVRTAKAKHYFPKKFYKKKAASEKMKKLAMTRLRRLIKEAKFKRVVKFKAGPQNVVRGATVRGAAKLPPKQVHQLHVPHGMKAKKRGRLAMRLLGGRSMKVVPTAGTRAKQIGSLVADKAGMHIAGRLRAAALAPAAASVVPEVVSSATRVPTSVPRLSPKSKSMAKKIMRGAGLASLGVGTGAAAHQVAQSTGLTSTGPADTVANLLVPTEE